MALDFDLELQAAFSGYDRRTCWVHARAGVIPRLNTAVLTTQKLRLSGSDIFYALHSAVSRDSGRTWSDLKPQKAFEARPVDERTYFYVSDFWPKWHAASDTLLGTGHAPLYRDDELVTEPFPRRPVYSVYDAGRDEWRPWRFLEIPGDPFYNSGAGCVQRVDLPDGRILLPIYWLSREQMERGPDRCSSVAVLLCDFDGETLRCLDVGNSLTVPDPRGLGEPSLARFAGRFYLTMRNDLRGYVAVSDDGLHYGPPQPWTFDDGEELGNYNTQQHWVVHSEGLFLVYTRRGAGNDHVFRHRAPLFIGRVDPDRLCVIRESERVVVPERGARLGNFGITAASPQESWVVVAEWMQTGPPDPFDCTVCERYGSDNTIFIARLHWNRPNSAFPYA